MNIEKDVDAAAELALTMLASGRATLSREGVTGKAADRRIALALSVMPLLAGKDNPRIPMVVITSLTQTAVENGWVGFEPDDEEDDQP